MTFSNRYAIPLAAVLCSVLFFSCISDNELPQSGVIYGAPVTYGGEIYLTVVIGTQTWFKRNLNYNAPGSKCYGNDQANCAKYGRLYDWKTATVACPSGWHLPNDAEWDNLIYFVGDSIAGIELKAKYGWIDDGNGTDAYGFSAMPGGIGEADGSFRDVGEYGVWWSSRENYENDAYGWLMYYDYDYASYSVGDKDYLLSVRCLKDH